MNNIKKTFESILADRKLKSTLWILTLGAAVVIFLLAYKENDMQGRFIVDKSGNLKGIERESLDKSEEYKFKLKIKKKGGTEERDVSVRLHPIEKDPSKTNIEDKESETEMIINAIINEIEFSDKKEIPLPEKAQNGMALRWEAIEEKDTSSFIIIPILYFILVLLLIKNTSDKEKNDISTRQKSILRGLPRFCNQLWLMMNAGMILSDTIDYISKNYDTYEEDERGFFENEVVMIARACRERNSSTASVITEFASKNNVKELIRIAVILSENEKRGSDVIENLSRESKYLWDNRKTMAREQGKLIDTRMTYPMGMLLILLIVITMAPALLNI